MAAATVSILTPHHLLWTGTFRVYVNSFREAPYIWSIDDGDPAHEVKCTHIHMDRIAVQTGSHASVQPGYTPQPEDQRVAKAWLSGRARVLQLPHGEILLQPIRSARAAHT